jgi:hypothetical protein
MTGVPSGVRLYMGISGGIDSAYLGWRLLQAGYPLLLNYTQYRTKQNRWPHEDIAYRAVLDWFTDQGLTNWTLLPVNNVEFRQAIGYWFLDHEYLYGFLAGAQLRNKSRRDIKFLADSGHKNSRNRQDATYQRIWRQLNTVAERKVKPVFPLRNLTKAQIIQDMPPDLLALTWSCRAPRSRKPCGSCSTCRDIAAVERGS